MKRVLSLFMALVMLLACTNLLPVQAKAAESVDGSDLKFVQAPGLSFQNNIGIQLLVDATVASRYDQVCIMATQAGKTTYLYGTSYMDLYQMFEHQVLSWSMAETVSLMLCGKKDGKVYVGATVTTSVKKLAMQKISAYSASNNAQAVTALVDMLNFGAAVQTAFDHNASKLPNADLGEYASKGTKKTPTLASSNVTTGYGSIEVLKSSISMQAKVELQLLFKEDISKYTVRAMVGGETVPAVIDKETMADYGWTIVKVAVGASQMRHKFTIMLTTYYGYQITPCYNLSVEAFAQEQMSGDYKDVVVAMMKYGDSVDAIASSAEQTLAAKIIRTAKKYLGVPYEYGGEDPTGFDCSGYMQYAFGAHGVTLPRTSSSQSQYGTAVSRSDLKPGDLIFFDTSGNGKVNHVGLYMGDGYFIHASTKRGMEIADLYDGYWLYHYLNARRVLE